LRVRRSTFCEDFGGEDKQSSQRPDRGDLSLAKTNAQVPSTFE